MKKLFAVLLIALMAVASVSAAPMNALDYIAENADRAFVTGKADYTIQAMMVSEPVDIYNELELVSYHVEDDGKSVILKGTIGEEWVADISRVLSTYTHVDGTPLAAEDLTGNKDTFIDIRTIAEPDTNFALLVPADTVLEVHTAWGDILYTNASDAPHGEGDYLVCRNVDGQPDLSDVWVVNGAVFPSTYDMPE